MEFVTSIAVHACDRELQDRAAILRFGSRVLLAVADGAGGISGGAQAADLFIRSVQASSGSLNAPDDCRALLNRIDQELLNASDCGETTGLVAVIGPNGIFGASVGDSTAWLFCSTRRVELTAGQHRKPFLGSGVAVVCPFADSANEGTIVVATDGLWKYAGLESIERRTRIADPSSLAEELSGLVRLRSSALPDDVAIATCRAVP